MRLVACLTIMISSHATAQDLHYSQLTSSPLLQNPANAGNEFNLRGIVSHRNQWKHISSAFVTTGFSVDGRIMKKKLQRDRVAIGLVAYNDQAGGAGLKSNQVNASFAYHIALAKDQFLAAGIMLGYAQRSIDYSKFRWYNQYDGTGYNASLPNGETPLNTNQGYLDAGLGLVWQYDSRKNNVDTDGRKAILLGISMFHPHKPVESFISDYNIERKYVFHGHSTLAIAGNNLELLPAFQFMKQGTQQELVGGTSVRYLLKADSKYTGYVSRTSISVGAYYRMKDAVIIALAMQARHFTLGLSYDATTSALATSGSATGAIELTLMYAIGK